ncbi:MAG TPA: D-sedoheptulose 7-phosphate isomerase [Verrucomicrobiota bacterium]|nr:D-sedoheptulose 7-phosphate isomerase [Verrucomicrobiota bacterium]
MKAEWTDLVRRRFRESSAAKTAAAEDDVSSLTKLISSIQAAFQQGSKLVLFGNGGSAADAQHVAAEFVVRFGRDRSALPAIALTTDTSILTAVGNDLAFEQLFSRQVEAIVRPGDVVVGISTSGNSPNVLRGIEAGKARSALTVGFTGRHGGALRALADLCYCAPSDVTARIQEVHLCAWHTICEVIESGLDSAGTPHGRG